MSDADAAHQLLDELAVEFTDRQRHGEHPSIEEYAARHPDLAEEIRELFPTIAAVEQMKQRAKAEPPSLGEERPETLGDFRLVRELGRGGMGIVYEARQESLGRQVAVKVLPPRRLESSKQLERFHREARTAGSLHHTNIVPVFGVGEHGEFHYYVMQLIDGVGLDRVLSRFRGLQDISDADLSGVVALLSAESAAEFAGVTAPTVELVDESGTSATGPSTASESATGAAATDDARGEAARGFASRSKHWRSVAKMGLQVAEALSYAHGQGVLHRDIKPANLLLDERGTVWVADFGLASAADQSQLSHTGDIVGTIRYMSPERFRGEADPRSDVYSLGLTLWECLTLRPPFEASGRTSLIENVQQGRLTPLRKVCPQIPQDLATIVLKATACEPAHRYASAAELAGDLRCFLEDRPIRARSVSSRERLWLWCRRNPAVASLTTAVLALLVTVAVVASVGYLRVQGANVEVGRALEEVTRQKENAEAVLDTIFRRLAPATDVSWGDSAFSEDVDEAVGSSTVLSDETATLLEELVGHYEELSDVGAAGDPRISKKAADARLRVARIRFRLGKYEESARDFERALGEHEALGVSDLRLASLGNELGLVYHMMGDRRRSRQAHSVALERVASLTAQGPGDAAVRFEFARTHYLLALRLGPGEGWQAPPLPGGRRSPGRGRSPPGGGPSDEGSPDEKRPPRGDGPPPRDKPPPRGDGRGRGREGSREHLALASTTLESLAEEFPGRPEYQRLLALSYLERARGRRGPSRGGEALRGDAGLRADTALRGDAGLRADTALRGDSGLRDAVAILEELVVKYPESPAYRSDLVDAYGGFSPRGVPDAELETARARLEKALVHARRLAREQPNEPRYSSALVHVHFKLGSILERWGRQGDEKLLELAGGHFREAEQLQAALVRRFVRVGSFRVWHAILRDTLARWLLRAGRLDEAQAVAEVTVGELETFLAAADENGYAHGVLADAYRLLSEIHRQAGREQLASEMSRKSRTHREAMRPFERSRGRRRGR